MQISKNDLKEEEIYLKKVNQILNQVVKSNNLNLNQLINEVTETKKYVWNNYINLDWVEKEFFRKEIHTNISLFEDLSQKTHLLRNMINSPYFGRFDFIFEAEQDSEKVYIGLTNLSNENLDIFVYDWRSPIASLYYDYELGKASYDSPNGIVKGAISLKRQYKIENGKLIYAINSSINIDDDVLLETLSLASGENMRTIVQTIQYEQNQVIRNTKNDCLIVEGPAGSGKTSVALHRIAYLMYKYKENLKSNEVLIFSPNEIFSNYISEVLPNLGETNVLQTSFIDFINSFISEYNNVETYMKFLERIHNKDNNKYISIKMDNKFVEIIDDYINELKEKIKFQNIYYNKKLILDRNEFIEIFQKELKNKTIIESINKVTDYCIIKNKNIFKKKIDQNKFKLQMEKTFGEIYNIKNAFQEMFLSRTFKEKFEKIFETEYELFSDTILSDVKDKKIFYEDSILFIYFKFKLLGIESNKVIKQVIIDEAQDYTKIQYLIIKKIFPKANFTILGDVNQNINQFFGYDNLNILLDFFKEKNTKKVYLGKSYRNTYEITQYSNKMLNLNTTIINRHGLEPIEEHLVKKEEIIKIIKKELEQLDSKKIKSIAIITKSKKDVLKISKILKNDCILNSIVIDEYNYTKKNLIILPIYLAKGLEFDEVIIYETKENVFMKKGSKLAYVACTRALHKLIVLSEIEVKEVEE